MHEDLNDQLREAAINQDVAREFRQVKAEMRSDRARISSLEAGLRRALEIIDSPNYRDSTGLRPASHPAVDSLRALVDAGGCEK